MSGLVGGAGSKSGIIGETEIEYEEGTFTCSKVSGGTGTGSYTGTYVKVGKMVQIIVNFNTGDRAPGSGTYWSLPFDADSTYWGLPEGYNNDTGAYAGTGRTDGGSTRWLLYSGVNSANYQVQLIYKSSA